MRKVTATIAQLKNALGQIKNQITQVVLAEAQDFSFLDASKQDKPLKGSVTIPTTGWGSDSTADYPMYYDFAVANVTDADHASVDLSPASLSKAANCGLCSSCETLAGKIRLRAVSVPTETMTATYWIEKGV